jgi:hypothetical protein
MTAECSRLTHCTRCSCDTAARGSEPVVLHATPSPVQVMVCALESSMGTASAGLGTAVMLVRSVPLGTWPVAALASSCRVPSVPWPPAATVSRMGRRRAWTVEGAAQRAPLCQMTLTARPRYTFSTGTLSVAAPLPCDPGPTATLFVCAFVSTVTSAQQRGARDVDASVLQASNNQCPVCCVCPTVWVLPVWCRLCSCARFCFSLALVWLRAPYCSWWPSSSDDGRTRRNWKRVKGHRPPGHLRAVRVTEPFVFVNCLIIVVSLDARERRT